MTIQEKYLELRKKSVNRKKIIDTCSPTLKTDQNLSYTSRCFFFKKKPQNVLNISRDTSNMAYDTLSDLKKILYAP